MVSPLRRARETFELSRANGRHVSFDSRLIECRFEIDYATLLPYATPECAQPDVYDAWLWSARRRVTVVLDEIRSSGDRSVLLVSHWGFLNLLLLTQLGGHIPEELDKKSLKFSAPMANCAISVVVLEHGKYGDALLRWNDCAHLDGLLDGPFRW